MKTIFVSTDTFDSLDAVLSLSPEKVVLLAEKERLAEALRAKDAFAVKHGLPAEVAAANTTEEVFSALGGEADAALCVLTHTAEAYPPLVAAFVLGLPVFVQNGAGWEKLPTPTRGLKETLSPFQLKVLQKLGAPHTHEQLLLELSVEPPLLFYHLYEDGRGLVKLGLVNDGGERLELTRLGKLVAGKPQAQRAPATTL